MLKTGLPVLYRQTNTLYIMYLRKLIKPAMLAIALAAGVCLPAFSQKIGLQLYSLREQFKTDVPGTLALINKMGIREVEGGSSYGLAANEFKSLLKKNKLKVVGVGADFAALGGDLAPTIENAKTYGAKYVITYWIPHKGNDFTFDDIKNATEVFNKAGKILAESGLSFCYHPHGYEFRPYEDGTLLDYMIKNTDPRYVNFEMDVFWVKHPGQDPVALLKKYPNRFPLMHLKDRAHGTEGNQNGHADVESNVVLGTGDVGIAEIMKAAREVGVKHYFIEDESSRSVEQIPQSLEFLKSLR